MSVEISPATRTSPVVTRVSQATRPCGSSAMIASRTASEIWSASLSGCPSVTDSEVNRYRFAIRRIIDRTTVAIRRWRAADRYFLAQKFCDAIEDSACQLALCPGAKRLVVAGRREDHRVVGLAAEARSLPADLV